MEKNTQNSLLLTPEEENIYEAGARSAQQRRSFIIGVFVGIALSILAYALMDLILYGF